MIKNFFRKLRAHWILKKTNRAYARSKQIHKSEIEIVEGVESTFHYHLRIKGEKKPLCGYKYVMHTDLPIDTWGLKTHLNERYCSECERTWKEWSELQDDIKLWDATLADGLDDD